VQNIYDLAHQHRMLADATRFAFSRLSPQVGDYKWSCRQADFCGWMLCDGRSLSPDQHKELFDVVGTAFGGGGEDFKLPDFRSRVMGAVGPGGGGSLTPRSLGAVVGDETHTLVESEMPSHVHSGTTDAVGAHSHATNAVGGQGNAGLCVADGNGTGTNTDSSTGELNVMTLPTALAVSAAGNHAHAFTSGYTGLGQAHNNMQPTLFGGSVFVFTGHVNAFVA
jgi:microcystin-dependent protein